MTQENQASPDDQSKEQLDADQQTQAAAEPELAAQTPTCVQKPRARIFVAVP